MTIYWCAYICAPWVGAGAIVVANLCAPLDAYLLHLSRVPHPSICQIIRLPRYRTPHPWEYGVARAPYPSRWFSHSKRPSTLRNHFELDTYLISQVHLSFCTMRWKLSTCTWHTCIMNCLSTGIWNIVHMCSVRGKRSPYPMVCPQKWRMFTDVAPKPLMLASFECKGYSYGRKGSKRYLS